MELGRQLLNRDEPFGDSCPIEDKPLDFRDRCLYYDSRVGFLPRNRDKLAVTQSGMSLDSCLTGDEPWQLPSGDEPSGW